MSFLCHTASETLVDPDWVSQNPLGDHMTSDLPVGDKTKTDSISQDPMGSHMTSHVTPRSYQRSSSPEY